MKRALLVAAALLNYGCASAPKPLYNWQTYQQSVYQYLEDKDRDKQIGQLEENIQIASSKGEKLPPGFHAHLAMLYSQQGRDDLALDHFAKEKQAFAESAPFIDWLTRQQRGVQP